MAKRVPTFSLQGHEHIALNNLLKLEGWLPSGGAAKQVIDAGNVQVDGEVELRRRAKIVAGQTVQWHGHVIRVIE